MDDKQFQLFVEEVRSTGRVDLASAAANVGLNWFRDIKPLILKDENKRAILEEILEGFRLELLQNIMENARNGKQSKLGGPDLASINAMIKHIDTGSILGIIKQKEEDLQEPELGGEALIDHLKRLGINKGS